MNSVVITGVSTGIGRATAVDLAGHGFHVFGSVRNEGDADSLKERLGNAFTPLVFDVADAEAIERAAAAVGDAVGEQGLHGLVNNAGICLIGPLQHMPLQQFLDHFEVNVFGLLKVTRAFLPLLGAQRNCPHPPGRIINISSLSGRIAYPLFGAYAGSKFAVEALSDALRREMMLYGIRVSLIEPGAIQTPIWEKGASMDLSPYSGTDYMPLVSTMLDELSGQSDDALPVSRVTRVIRRALLCRRPRTRYVVANSPLTRWWIPHVLPDRWLDFVLRHFLNIRRLGSRGDRVPAGRAAVS